MLHTKKSFFKMMLFPFSLVLFELTVYTANDMIQPAMIDIVKNFKSDLKWVPTALTAYLAGGLSLQWLFGPLSDRFGRRPIMLFGITFFIFSCLLILFVNNVEQFIIVRFLQGIGLCFIGSIGYASIQEIFEEKLCIRLIALMANISLVAPLFGPLIGATIVSISGWKKIFIIFAVMSTISLVGLFFFMPETILRKKKFSFKKIYYSYKKLVHNLKFLFGSLTIGFANAPLLSWIALSPLILINERKLSVIKFAMLQTPIFISLILGNMILNFLVKKKDLITLIKIGTKPMILGILISSLSYFYEDDNYFFFTISGLSVYACGLGINNACVTRLTLFSSNMSKGIVSSAMSIISMIIMMTGIETSKKMYLYYDSKEFVFNIFNLFGGLFWFVLVVIFVKKISNKSKNFIIKK